MRFLVILMVLMYCVASAARCYGLTLTNHKHVDSMNEAIEKVMLERLGRKLEPKHIARFWGMVDKKGPDECWEWKGYTGGNYGRLRVGDKHFSTHVVSHILHGGTFHRGNQVRHVVCRNRACVNPAHLLDGTHKDNMADMTRDGSQSRGERHSNILRRVTPKGNQSWSYLHPERLARGDRSGARLHPETRPRGETVKTSTMREDQIREIRRLWDTRQWKQIELAIIFNTDQTNISLIVHRKSWKHVI